MGALIALANTAACSNKNSSNNLKAVLMDEINHLILEGLFTTITNVNFDDASIKNLTARIHALLQNELTLAMFLLRF